MLHVNSLILAIESLANLGYSLRVGHEPTLPTVGLLNLMPKKVETEQDFCRMLAASGINLNLVLLKIPGSNIKPRHRNMWMRTMWIFLPQLVTEG